MMKKMRVLAAAITAMMAITFGTAATASAYPAYVETDMNFRNGPGTNHTRIGSVPAGAKVDVIGKTQNGWEVITYNGVMGFISGGNTTTSYVPSSTQPSYNPTSSTQPSYNPTPAQQPTYNPAPSQQTGMLTVRNLQAGYLAIRTAPALDVTNEIGQLYNGMRVQVTGGYSGNGYVYVYSPDLGIQGWVNQNFVG